MSLITVVAAYNADSYVTLNEANAYIANRPDSQNWGNCDFLERERVLKQAAIDIDTLRFRGTKLICDETDTVFYYPPQSLQFPRSWHEQYSGYAESGSTTTLIDTAFADFIRPDDFFKYGSIHIVDGTNEGESREITGYTYSSSTFTVSPAFSSAIDATSQYLILAPIDRFVKYAQCEQGLFATNHIDTVSKYTEWRHAGVTAVSIGDVSVRFGGTQSSPGSFSDRVSGIVSASAFKYIRKFLDTDLKSGRA